MSGAPPSIPDIPASTVPSTPWPTTDSLIFYRFMQITVIGSGFGGLAAAIRLQTAGHAVTLLEKRDRPGGRAYVYAIDGFTFDGGPTVITAPWLIEELFTEAGRDPTDYLEMITV